MGPRRPEEASEMDSRANIRPTDHYRKRGKKGEKINNGTTKFADNLNLGRWKILSVGRAVTRNEDRWRWWRCNYSQVWIRLVWLIRAGAERSLAARRSRFAERVMRVAAMDRYIDTSTFRDQSVIDAVRIGSGGGRDEGEDKYMEIRFKLLMRLEIKAKKCSQVGDTSYRGKSAAIFYTHPPPLSPTVTTTPDPSIIFFLSFFF